jgi:hypothetical protein
LPKKKKTIKTNLSFQILPEYIKLLSKITFKNYFPSLFFIFIIYLFILHLLKANFLNPGAVTHTFNPSYLGEEIGGWQFKANLGKKVSKTLSQRTSQMWWYIPVIPTTQEV